MARDHKSVKSISGSFFSLGDLKAVGRLCITFLAGAVGGWLFYLLSIPLPWMLGAMVTTTTLALCGRSLQRPIKSRLIMLAVLGVTLGSSFTPDVLARSAGWIGSITAMTGFIVIVSAISYTVFQKYAGLDHPTAFFSSVPAGVNDMVVVGGAMGGEERLIALIHGIRILVTVLSIPLFFRITMGVTHEGSALPFIEETISIIDVGLLLMSGILGYLIARLLHFPAPAIIGPMIASAACHLSGLTASEPPTLLVNTAQVVVGSAIGCRFIGIAIRRVGSVLLLAAVNTAFLVLASALAAWGFATLFHVPFAALWLALAPGGLAEMLLVGTALGIDPAFVAAHHLFRVAIVILGAPMIYRLMIAGHR